MTDYNRPKLSNSSYKSQVEYDEIDKMPIFELENEIYEYEFRRDQKKKSRFGLHIKNNAQYIYAKQVLYRKVEEYNNNRRDNIEAGTIPESITTKHRLTLPHGHGQKKKFKIIKDTFAGKKGDVLILRDNEIDGSYDWINETQNTHGGPFIEYDDIENYKGE